MARANPILDWTTIAIFAACVLAPFVDQRVREDFERAVEVEFRSPTRQPLLPGGRLPLSKRGLEFLRSEEGRAWLADGRAARWALRFPGRYERYYSDSFGLRDHLIRYHNGLTWFGLRESPTSLLVRGQDDWVYFTANHALDDWRGARPFAEQDLRAWTHVLTARRDALRERGIEYLLCVAPDKETLYPEFLPGWMQAGETRLAQLKRALTERGGPELLDLTAALVAEKAGDREEDHVYRRLGSHWTDRGAWAASVAIADRLRAAFPQVAATSRDDYRLVEGEIDLSDDMAGRMYLEGWLERREYALEPLGPPPARQVERLDGGRDFRYSTGDPELPRAVCLHDSFGAQIRPFLAASFSDTLYLWQYDFDVEELAREEPDVVVQLLVERSFDFLAPELPRGANQERARVRFEASDDVVWTREGGDVRGLRAESAADLDVREGRVVLETRNGSGALAFDVGTLRAGRDHVLALELESDRDDEVRLLYVTQRDPAPEPRRSLVLPVKEGTNRLYFELLAADVRPEFVLYPGRGRGRTTFLRCELRAVGESP